MPVASACSLNAVHAFHSKGIMPHAEWHSLRALCIVHTGLVSSQIVPPPLVLHCLHSCTALRCAAAAAAAAAALSLSLRLRLVAESKGMKLDDHGLTRVEPSTEVRCPVVR